MDIVTHAMMGVIVASPLLLSHPEAAAAYIMGAVMPDLDAFSRVFGKRAFLRAHQTWSHALPVIALIGVTAGAIGSLLGLEAYAAVGLGLGLALGMASHSLLDVTNTYGITLFAPFSRRRYCLEWVFFIDALVVAISLLTLGFILSNLAEDRVGWQAQAAYGGFVVLYWTLKWRARRRAQRLAPAGTLSLLPSALVPWRYLGCARDGARATLFQINAITGRVQPYQTCEILDARYLPALETIPEFRIMRTLSPAYHAVEVAARADGATIYCRDLRTRNFRTRFGELEVDLDTTGTPCEVRFHA